MLLLDFRGHEGLNWMIFILFILKFYHIFFYLWKLVLISRVFIHKQTYLFLWTYQSLQACPCCWSWSLFGGVGPEPTVQHVDAPCGSAQSWWFRLTTFLKNLTHHREEELPPANCNYYEKEDINCPWSFIF